jgi:ArsR family transcriptional regulator
MTDETNSAGVEDVFRALADETRLAMLRLLIDKRELCVCEVVDALDISQTRASRNLGFLCHVGLLRGERRGKWVYYSVDRNRDLRPLLAFVRRQVSAIAAGSASRERKC